MKELLKNKFLWIGVSVLATLALPKLSFGQKKLLYSGVVVGALAAAWFKKISWKMCAAVAVPVVVVWGFTYWQVKNATKQWWTSDVTVTEAD